MIDRMNRNTMIGRLKRGLKRSKRGNPEGDQEKLREGANAILQTNMKGLGQPRNYFPLYLSGILKTKATANRQSNWLVVVLFIFLYLLKFLLSCFSKRGGLLVKGMQESMGCKNMGIRCEKIDG